MMVFALSLNNAFSQDICKVLKPEISGQYSGDCKNGLADGKGIAEGQDTYEGKFKKGLPNGLGTYTWSTGEVYKGSWKDGKEDGNGQFTFKSKGCDTTTTGVWKADVFSKIKVPEAYDVHRNNGIKRYNVTRLGDGAKISLAIMKDGSNNTSLYGFTFYCSSGTTYIIGPKIGYENVIFPCTMKIIYTTRSSFGGGSISCEFEIEFKTPGKWDITLNN